MSQEYIGAIVLAIGALLRLFNIVEIDNKTIEGLVVAVIAIWIAIRRQRKGDITPLGFRK